MIQRLCDNKDLMPSSFYQLTKDPHRTEPKADLTSDNFQFAW